MKLYIFTLFCLIFSLDMVAQKVVFQEDPILVRELSNMKTKNHSIKEYQGWRIQFFYTDNRREFDDQLNKIEQLYPEYDIEWKQRSPFYYIYGGAYIQKLKALEHLNQIKEEYPSAILTRATISKEEVYSNF